MSCIRQNKIKGIKKGNKSQTNHVISLNTFIPLPWQSLIPKRCDCKNQKIVNSNGILFTIYRHRTQPVRNYKYAPYKSLQH
jgi:hypothetical protein